MKKKFLLDISIRHSPFVPPNKEEKPQQDVLRAKEKNLDMFASCLSNIIELGARAANGNQEAAEFLSGIARYAVIELNALAEDQPNLLKNIAKKTPQWPMLVARTHESKTANKELIAKLELGVEADLKTQNANWNRKNVTTQYAIRLHETLETNKNKYANLNKKSPQWALSCGKLPPFSTKTAKKWWRVAREALREAVPHIENVPELRKLVLSASSKKAYFPSEIKSKIEYKIERVFINLPRNFTPHHR
ncbi:MAG: hypothetical protein PHV34_24540 [Verrucomicrobiae bacterium]|nr:hypothetical protein [Verrucomicrobiae bacterium]